MTNTVSIQEVNIPYPYTQPFGGIWFGEEKQEIHDIFVKQTETGNILDEDTTNRIGFSYNKFNSQASLLFHDFLAKYHFSFIEDVIGKVALIYSNTTDRTINLLDTNALRTFLKNNFPPATFEFLRDLFAYGWAGYFNTSTEDKEMFVRIPVRDCEIYFPNTSDEFLRFFGRTTYSTRSWIEYHSLNTISLINNMDYTGMNYFKVVDGKIVAGYKKKPYMIYIHEFDDRTEKPNSICMKLKKVAMASSEMHGLLLHLTHKAVNPPIVVDMDSNPRSEDMLDSMNPTIDLRPNGVNHVNGMRNGMPIQPIMDKTSGGTHAEIMSYLNNLDGYIASSFHVSAMMGATKSNVTEGAINQVNQIQDLTMEEERRKFVREFFKIFLFQFCNKFGFKIKSPEDLYFGAIDGNLNQADQTKQSVMNDAMVLLQAGLGNLIDPQKLVKVLQVNSVIDIYSDNPTAQAQEQAQAMQGQPPQG